MNEKVTYGTNGWYWECANGRYGVVITNHILANRHFNKFSDYAYPVGSECIVYLNKEDLANLKIDKMLRVNKNKQVELALLHDKRYSGSDTPKSGKNNSIDSIS